jgi:hypothetical protein
MRRQSTHFVNFVVNYFDPTAPCLRGAGYPRICHAPVRNEYVRNELPGEMASAMVCPIAYDPINRFTG